MQPRTPQAEHSLFLSRAETARLMGISLRTLEKLIAAGEIPTCLFRRRRLVPRAFLEDLAKRMNEVKQ
jgi:excisionase family DNA binding protein